MGVGGAATSGLDAAARWSVDGPPRVLDGVFWRTRTGAPWRDLPTQYGNWKTVYSRRRRWSADDTWVAVLDRLRQDCDREEGAQWTVGVDSTIVRAHQHAAGARREASALTEGSTELHSRRGA